MRGRGLLLLIAALAIWPAVGSANTLVERALDSLEWRRPVPQGNDLYSAAYGNGRYVMVGRRGTILTSIDDAHWTVRNEERFRDLVRVAWGNGKFVAVGTFGGIFVSSDGLNWETRSVRTNDQLSAVTYGNGVWVVGAYETSGAKQIYTSTDDGLTWVPRMADTVGDMPDVAFGAGRFIGVSYNFALTSTNGLNWTRVVLPAGASAVRNVVYGNGRFVVGGSGYSATSIDGLNWDSAFGLNYSGELVAGAGAFVRLDGSGGYRNNRVFCQYIFHSPDGLFWSAAMYYNNYLFGAAYVGDHFVAVGNNGVWFTSTNGVTWVQRTHGTENNLRSITYGNGNYVAVGNGGMVWISPDGLQWQTRAGAGNRNFRGIVHAQGRFVAVAGTGVYTSETGENWALRAGGTRDLLNIAYEGSAFVAVGEFGTVMTSSNGLNWRTQAVTNLGSVQGIAYGNGLYVVTGSGGMIFTSLNASNWTRQSSPTNYYLQGAVYGNGRFVAVGTGGTIVSSSDGSNWSLEQSPGRFELEHVTFAEGHFVAVGEDGIVLSSTNGVDWTRHFSGSHNNLRYVHYAQGVFTIVGNNDLIMQSGQVLPLVRITPRDDGERELQIRAMPGRLYRLQASDDLENWDDLFIYQNNQRDTLFLDSDSVQHPARFYRVTFEP